jgi:hypothetical protein
MSRRSNLFGVGISTLPSWADYTALPNGQFIEFTTNTPESIGMTRSTLYNWVGGAFVPDYGARGALVVAGGGEHVTWWDSHPTNPSQGGAYVLDCDARTYSRKCFPTAQHSGILSDGGGSPATDDWGAYIDDGAPQAKHTYNCMSYMPASWGGGSSGSLMRVSHTGGISISRGATVEGYTPGLAATWRYDLSKTAHTLADPSIIKLTGSQTYDFGSGLQSTLNDAPAACIDLTREGWWSTSRTGTGNNGDRMVFTSKSGVVSAPQGVSKSTGWMALHHFADDDIIVRLTDDNVNPFAVMPTWQVFVWQAGTANAWQQATLTRQDISDTYPAGFKAYPSIGYHMHPRWSTILGCFVGYDSTYTLGTTTTIRVWKITPPPAGQRFSGTWTATWELVTAKAGTTATNFMNHTQNPAGDAGVLNGVYGRLVECPSLRAFVWTRDVNKPGQLIRLQGM